MKIVIDIDEEIYNLRDYWSLGISLIVREAIRNGTPLPDNATNGDVLKALFPKGKEINLVYSLEYRIDDEVTLLGVLNWWNAPYSGLRTNIPKRGQRVTNGDVIKALFPDIEIADTPCLDKVYTGIPFGKYISANIDCMREWWNAPYKVGDTDGNS